MAARKGTAAIAVLQFPVSGFSFRRASPGIPSVPGAAYRDALLRRQPKPLRFRSVRIILFSTRRYLRYLVQEFLFLWRKIPILAGFDLPPPSLGRHSKQSFNDVSHFLPLNHMLLVVRQPVLCRAGVSGCFVVRERPRRDPLGYAGRSRRPGIARILLRRVVPRISIATVIGVRWPIRVRPIVWVVRIIG